MPGMYRFDYMKAVVTAAAAEPLCFDLRSLLLSRALPTAWIHPVPPSPPLEPRLVHRPYHGQPNFAPGSQVGEVPRECAGGDCLHWSAPLPLSSTQLRVPIR